MENGAAEGGKRGSKRGRRSLNDDDDDDDDDDGDGDDDHDDDDMDDEEGEKVSRVTDEALQTSSLVGFMCFQASLCAVIVGGCRQSWTYTHTHTHTHTHAHTHTPQVKKVKSGTKCAKKEPSEGEVKSSQSDAGTSRSWFVSLASAARGGRGQADGVFRVGDLVTGKWSGKGGWYVLLLFLS